MLPCVVTPLLFVSHLQYVYQQMPPMMYGNALGPMQVPQQAQYAANPAGMGLGDPSQSDPSAAAVGNQMILDPYTPLQDQLMHVRRVVGPAAPGAAVAMGAQAASQQGFPTSQPQGLVTIMGPGAGQSRVPYLAAPVAPQQGVAALESPSMGGMGAGPLESPSASGSAPQSTLSYAMNGAQMGLMQTNMYNIQSISGAQLSTQSLGPGMFYLTLTGTSNQVETASQLVSNVLAKSTY